MSRLAPAIRHRRRQLDEIALAIATEQRALADIEAAAERLARQHDSERRLARAGGNAADAWFAQARRRLDAFAASGRSTAERLALLRTQATDLRARLQLLEDAAAEEQAKVLRHGERRAQAALDDRTAALWQRR